jgi:hypothetical protein
MKNYTEGVPVPLPQATDAVAQLDLVVTPDTANRPAVNREEDSIAFLQGHNGHPGLHPRTLLSDNELAALEVLAGLGEQHGQL